MQIEQDKTQFVILEELPPLFCFDTDQHFSYFSYFCGLGSPLPYVGKEIGQARAHSGGSALTCSPRLMYVLQTQQQTDEMEVFPAEELEEGWTCL